MNARRRLGGRRGRCLATAAAATATALCRAGFVDAARVDQHAEEENGEGGDGDGVCALLELREDDDLLDL